MGTCQGVSHGQKERDPTRRSRGLGLCRWLRMPLLNRLAVSVASVPRLDASRGDDLALTLALV